MAFSQRRGRPRSETLEEDRGTPELQRKRRLHLTAEPLDRLLAQGEISPDQHWCGMHLRWLFTLRYGAATPQALDPARIKGMLHKKPNDEWQSEREEEWREALELLKRERCLTALLNLCIYHHAPSRLRETASCSAKMRDGLEALAQRWCRQNATG